MITYFYRSWLDSTYLTASTRHYNAVDILHVNCPETARMVDRESGTIKFKVFYSRGIVKLHLQ
jgi:hypothetical protein